MKLGIMKKVLLVLVAFLTISSLSAKESFMHHQLGPSASMFSGAGLSYKYIFNNIWAAKTTAFVYYNTDGNSNNSYPELWTSIGAEVQYYLHHSEHTGLYLFVGFAEWYEENNNNYDYEQNSSNSIKYYRMFDIGPGFGLDLIIWKNIVINLDVGFLYTIENNDYSWDNSDSNNRNPKSFTYGGGIGLGYRF